MIKVPFRAVLISLIALVAIGGLINLETAKHSALNQSFTNGTCSLNGTTLVIDFGPDSKREPITKCVIDFQGTGWQLIESAGLNVIGTSDYPESFVCRLEDFPNVQSEDCQGTPNPSNGSWVYFYSTLSTFDSETGASTWQHSPIGAASRTPDCGDYEGWLFSKPGTENSATVAPNQISIEPRPFACK